MKCTVLDVVDFYNNYPEMIGKLSVETRFGFKEIEFANVTSKNSEVVEIVVDDKEKLYCSPEHKLFSGQWTTVKDLSVGDEVLMRDGNKSISSKRTLVEREDLYDLQVAEVNEYYSNNFVSHNSIILDSICFCLFGKPFRSINKGMLVNSINEKNALVEMSFTTGGKSYLVRRGIRPNIFEIICDGKSLDQSHSTKDFQTFLEENILKVNYKAFTQVVVLGSATHTPFMQLRVYDRRKIVEDLLDISIFSIMNGILKDKSSILKKEIDRLTNDRRIAERELEFANENFLSIKERADSQIKVYLDMASAAQKEAEDLRQEVLLLQEETTKLSDSVSDLDSINASLNKLKNLQKKIEQTKVKNAKEIEFYQHSKDCPTCKQLIGEDFKSEKVQDLSKLVSEKENAVIEINTKIEELADRLSEIREVQLEVNKLNSNISKKWALVNTKEDHAKRMRTAAEESKQSNVDLVSAELKVEEMNKSIKQITMDFDKQSKEKDIFDVAQELLKDTGIKAKIIEQYLPVMNGLINKYLSKMDFFVSFEFDENFNETIKSRYRDDFTYMSFSEGEKQRIDLALLLTWRSIAKIKNSMNTNLLILDEVFDSSLDTSGTDEFLRIIRSVDGPDNVFVISHRGDMHLDKFDSCIRFEKSNNFTKMIEQ